MTVSKQSQISKFRNPQSEIPNPQSALRNPKFSSSFPSSDPFSLYVHIPYCVKKCPYCDFNSHVVADMPEQAYTAALTRELSQYAASAAWANRTIKTVFFGGGTPSIFTAHSIGAVVEKAAALFHFANDVEVTLEANPGTVDAARFREYRLCGINRLSIGAQTFNARLLEFLGRIHDAGETRRAFEAVRTAGFENFSLDLIYAMPGQTAQELADDLAEALEQKPPHLSVYNLTIEEGTPFHKEFQRGRLHSLDEDTEVEMADQVAGTLAEAGLRRYEISNYARTGFEAQHNLTYWKGGDYLGIGAGAHSFHYGERPPCGVRRQNERIPARYIRRIEETGIAVAGEERPERRQAMGEYLFTGLRLLNGISIAAFCARFGTTPDAAFPKIRDWLAQDLLAEENGYLRFTKPGLLLANELFVEFI